MVRFVGRFDRSDPDAARFAWSGSMVVGRFKGTGVSVRLHDDGRNLFQVLVDGEPRSVLKTDPTKETYALAEGLPDGVHDVAIYKRTEAKVGEAAFLGFSPEGTMLPAPPPAERRIELIGDSITAGYGNEGPGAVCTFNPAEENQYLTYGAVAARALAAEHVTIAWSGKTIGEMTDFYDKTLPARPDSPWDFTAWTPQLVVMNVGTNNFATYDPGETRYVRIYTNLFDRIRRAYPKALIVCMLGPMLTDVYPPGKRNLTLARKYMKAAMAKIEATGETNYEYVELPVQKHSDGLGCGFHPSLKTHKLMADRLVTVAKERLGW
jgi:lysophospholipase L1-like esterase